MITADGKNADTGPAWMTVVAAALYRDDGLWLLHRRPEGKHHAGLWEFPGGKVEANEIPHESLIRELSEELGIACRASDLHPASFAENAGEGGSCPLVILLYTLGQWDGDPRALEGGTVGWFTPQQALALPKPPLDVSLAARLFAKDGFCA